MNKKSVKYLRVNLIMRYFDSSIKRKDMKKPLTNNDLLEMLKAEIEKNGIGVWTSRRKTIEEMLRMRGQKL